METKGSPIIFVIVVALFAVIICYVIYAKIKRRGAAWTGTVIDKDVSETEGSSTGDGSSGVTFGVSRRAINRTYNVKVKSDAGEEFNWQVGEGFYESVKVGDRLTKTPGTETPTKI